MPPLRYLIQCNTTVLRFSRINQIVENIGDEPCESVNSNQLNLYD
jgi:hypothetical protein